MTDLALATFLTKCLNEDEWMAEAAYAHSRHRWASVDGDLCLDVGVSSVSVLWDARRADPRPPVPVVRHVAAHDPTSVVTDIGSKRRLIDLFSTMGSRPEAAGYAELGLRLMAEAYRGRDGWREEWSTT